MTRHIRENLMRALSQPTGPSSDFDFGGTPQVPVSLRPAGVLAAFDAQDGRLLLTKRASSLRHHPGQIALPGGKVDPSDADVTAAALREARGAANGLARAGADYVTEETGDVVARAELTAFHDQVDGLRDDVERIAARVSRLAQAGVAS